MSRLAISRLALVVAVLLGVTAAISIGWAARQPDHDVTETYIEMLSVVAAVGALVTYGLYRRFRP